MNPLFLHHSFDSEEYANVRVLIAVVQTLVQVTLLANFHFLVCAGCR